jgi:exodeoxyribonuclease VII large subunit
MEQAERKIYSLSTILKGVRDILESRIKGKYFWLKVEIANINFHSAGHCYLELIETKNGQSIAQCKGTIWKSKITNLKDTLGTDFSNVIKKGNEILCYVEIQFHEYFGLSSNILDIDLNFNLGALEKRKQETIERLTKENLLAKNKEHILPLVIQKIAIIGSAETAGITDLQKQLKSNIYKYCFEVEVFSCLVQGDKSEFEIISRLQQLKNSRFDIIALVRGGGSKLDLDIFNSYNIAKEIALHDKPIFTGIGHETDISVVDLCANIYHKTPTALGSFIVERARNFEVRFLTAYNLIIENKDRILTDRKNHLKLNIQTLTSTATSFTRLRRGDLHTIMNRILSEIRSQLHLEKNRISVAKEIIKTAPVTFVSNSRYSLRHTMEMVQINSISRIKQAINTFSVNLDYIFVQSKQRCSEKLTYMANILNVLEGYDPKNILSKGYAIPRFKDELLTNQELKVNDEIEIELQNRKILVSYIKTRDKWKNFLMNKLQKN